MSKTKLKIENRKGEVLFEHERENNTLRITLEEAVRQKADLSGADLSGANLWGAVIKDILIVGNIGSSRSYTIIYDTDKGIMIQCGCFFGDEKEFVANVAEKHGNNNHARDYLAMLDFAKVRFGIASEKKSES